MCKLQQERKDKMAVAQIRVKDNTIVLPTPNDINKQKVEVLGWTVSIQKNGTVICYKAQKAYDGWHAKRMIITPKGQVKITMKVGDKDTKTIKKFFLVSKEDAEEYKLDVAIVVTDSWVDDPTVCYVRKGLFQDFLDKNGITGIHMCNPNSITFTLNSLTRKDGQYSIENIQTDGKILKLGGSTKSTDFYSLSTATLMVRDATWVIKIEEQNRKHMVPAITKVLFTAAKNVTQLDLH